MIKNLAIVVLLCALASVSVLHYRAEQDSAALVAAWTEETVDARRERDKAHRFIEQVFNLDNVGELTTWSIPVTVSAYTARAEECDDNPETTADMTPSRIGLLAVSRDLIQVMGLRYGETVLLVDGGHTLGVFKVHDIMNARYSYRVDILHGNVKAARLFGVRKGVQLVRVLDYGKRS